MLVRKALALGGLMFTVAILSPAAALAAEGGTDRPLKWSATGTSELNLATGQNSIALTGHGTHMGLFQQTELAQLTPTGTPGVFNFNSNWHVVVASGDEVSGTCTGLSSTSDFVHIVVELDCASTSGTGTGRFEEASAVFEATANVTRVALAPPIAFNEVEISGEGTISY